MEIGNTYSMYCDNCNHAMKAWLSKCPKCNAKWELKSDVEIKHIRRKKKLEKIMKQNNKIVGNKKIRIYDDSRGDSDNFDIKPLFEDSTIIVGEATNEWYDDSFKVMIIKKDGRVLAEELNFYYAENYEEEKS
jgi:hypothetical protein